MPKWTLLLPGVSLPHPYHAYLLRAKNPITGGTAGCIVASRLAEADPDLSILIIEQGRNNFNVQSVIYPALFERNTMNGSDTALFWKANKSPQLADREPVVETGGILGGGSSINWMVYTRGQWDDFDSWDTPGWAAADVLPFLKKVCYFLATLTSYLGGMLSSSPISKTSDEKLYPPPQLGT